MKRNPILPWYTLTTLYTPLFILVFLRTDRNKETQWTTGGADGLDRGPVADVLVEIDALLRELAQAVCGVLVGLVLDDLHALPPLALLQTVLADHVQLANPVLNTQEKHKLIYYVIVKTLALIKSCLGLCFKRPQMAHVLFQCYALVLSFKITLYLLHFQLLKFITSFP